MAVRAILSTVIAGLCWVIFPAGARAQTDTVRVPGDWPGEGNLNRAVSAVASAGALSRTVFLLEPCGRYVLTGTINIPAGERLTMIAPEAGRTQQTAPPQILLASDFPETDTLITFRCRGTLVLRNVWLLYANSAWDQLGAHIVFSDSPDTVNGQNGEFDGVIFDYSPVSSYGGGAVDVTCRHFRGAFRNCYFKNCADRHFRYYGRALTFPFASRGWHIDSVLFENCTFANIGYVYSQEGGEYGDHIRFNHCTFLNVVMYPLESGCWRTLSVTNSIFVNTWMYGDQPIMRDAGESQGGTIRIDSIANFGFAVPFAESDRRILFSHSSYYVEEWLRAWMVENPGSVEWRLRGDSAYIPVPQPMLSPRTIRFFDGEADGEKAFPFMNRANLLDSTDPGFLLAPTNLEPLKRFLYMKWWCCCDTPWAYEPERSFNQEWPLRENLAYRHQGVLTAGMGGFPLGDLYRWFPDEYEAWKGEREGESARILGWLATGVDPGGSVGVPGGGGTGMPARFLLRQNFPNPFNPTTTIGYSVPAQSRVSLKVYDLLGREVAVLFEGVREAGEFTATFDGTRCAGGVYFCRMQSGDSAGILKLVLLK